MASEITSEKRGAALILSFNRPARANAFTSEMAAQLFNALKPAATDRTIRAVMLKGAGGTFMDGLDMELFAGDFTGALERVNEMFQPYHSAIRELLTMEKPVLAAIDGVAAGPGLSFVLASDLVLASRRATFNCKFSSYGLTPDGGCSAMLARKAGMMKANELLMLSENFSAADAARWNLVNAVVDDGKLQDEALAWLDRLAARPTRAYGGIKRLVMKAFEQDINAQISLEHAFWGASARSFDFREAVRAQAAKRPAKFTGT
jgi:2-(1,2-epoxy-1,2-dihydrophenyl)acetyl-CoA isomerase